MLLRFFTFILFIFEYFYSVSSAVDESLPKVLLDSIQTNLNMCGAIILTAFVNPIVLIPLSILSAMFWFVRGVYLKTSKSLKRLESVSKLMRLYITFVFIFPKNIHKTIFSRSIANIYTFVCNTRRPINDTSF